MDFNFKPEQDSYKPISTFKMHSPKVLPLVFDDSLSYYETLCKIVNALNDVINLLDTETEEYMQKAIDKFFNTLMLDAVYDEENEMIILKKVDSNG